MNINLQHEDNRIFALDENNEIIAEITFPKISDNKVDINRTFVHSSLRGQGIADELMQACVNKIQSNGFSAAASCSYAKKWFSDHPEFNNILED